MRKLFDLTFFPFLWKLHPTESKKTSVSEFNACAASSKPPVGSELSMCRGCPRALKLCQKPIKLVYISSVIVEWSTQPVAQLWVDGIDFFLYLCIHICRNWHYKMAGFLKLHNSWNRRFRELPIFSGVLRYMNFWFVKFFLAPKHVWILTPLFRRGHVFYANCPYIYKDKLKASLNHYYFYL